MTVKKRWGRGLYNNEHSTERSAQVFLSSSYKLNECLRIH
jgi:hypothetical protein